MSKNALPPKTQDLHPAFEAGKKPMDQFSKEELVDIEDRLRVATMSLLMRHEFFGIIALKLGRKITTEVPTAAVDGRTIFYNPGFVQALSAKELIFLVAHEVYHCVFSHFLRRGFRDPKLWNYAGDYVINYLLYRDKIGTTIKGTLFDEQFKDMTSEQVYDIMMKEQDKWKGSGLVTLDVHFDVNDGTGDGTGDGDKEGGNGGFTIDPADVQAIEDEIRATVVSAAKAAGNLPGEVRRLVDEFLTPKINWKELVYATVSSKQTYDTTFTRPHRRSWSNDDGLVFPGDLPDETDVRVIVSLDASGSYTHEQLKAALSEVYGLMQSYPSFKLHVFTFDTKVYNPQEFDETQADDLRGYEPKGGGGTAFVPFFKHVEKLVKSSDEYENATLVVFTDMYVGDLDEVKAKYSNLLDTVWIVDGNPDGLKTIPFGKGTIYEHGK